MPNRAQTIRKVRNYLIDPESQPPVSPTEMADLVVLVLSQVETIQKAIKEGRLDGKTPVPDKDYLSKPAAQKMLSEAINGMIADVDKALNEKGGALEAQVQQALQNIRDGEDGIVSDEEIGRAAQLAAELIDLPDFDEEITKAITSDGEAIRNALELLSGEDRYEVRIEDVNGLEERLQALRTTQGSNSMGTSKPAVYQFIRDAIADGIITTGSSPLTTKGDLYTYDTDDARLPVGSNGQVLQADSNEATGLKWATIAGTGDVTAASAFGTDNVLIRSDGTGKGVQATGISVADTTNNVSGLGTLASASGTLTIDETAALSDKQNVLAEGAFVDGDKTKLDGIEANADVTDTANVTAAGALMDSEVDADLKTLSLPANTTISTFGASLIDDADAATARATLSLVPGTDVQAFDAGLNSIAGLTTAADRMIYTTASDTYAVTALTSAARSILDDASTSAIRTTLGVGTAQSPQFTAVNIGNATDTTIGRTAAGIINVEGNPLSRVFSGAGAPATTPGQVGDIYIDTTGDDAYIAVGTASSSDWEKSNDGTGGGGTDISCRAFRTSSTALSLGTWTSIALDNESYDTDTMHDNATNNTRITFKTAGKYLVTGTVRFTTNKTHAARIYLNGTTEIALTSHGNSSANPEGGNVTTIYDFAVNDYVEIQGWTANTATSATGADLAVQKLA